MSREHREPQAAISHRWLWGLAGLTAGIYLYVAILSVAFEYHTVLTERPILRLIALLVGCFGIYAVAQWLVLKCESTWKTTRLILATSIGFRLIVLFSIPIQEVDIYRYVWDGAAFRHQVSPFRYSPHQVLTTATKEAHSEDLKILIAVRGRDRNLTEILKRVHYGQLTTIYPPVSQAVFATADLLTPAESSVYARVVIMKSMITLFDVGTILVLAKLLAMFHRHPGWLLSYGWCPLVIKEFSNSGHLDAIAVLLTMAALLVFVLAIGNREERKLNWRVPFAGLLLAFGIGAKLYPVVLVPLFVLSTWRRKGLGAATAMGMSIAAVTALILLPMFLVYPPANQDHAAEQHHSESRASGEGTEANAVLPPPPSSTDESHTTIGKSPMKPADAGLTTFLSRWEINDLLFMVVEENFRPTSEPVKEAWFVITPAIFRERLAAFVQQTTGIRTNRYAFTVTRIVTSATFLALALVLAWPRQLSESDNVKASTESILTAAFLTLAWFWLMSPTCNPWYWTWALPLMPFARGRTWFAVSGFLLVYYFRFWLAYHMPAQAVLGSRYAGVAFFDHVVVWIEFAPWLIALVFFAAQRRWRARS